MPLTIGPSAWWLKTRESVNYYAKLCPVGTTLPDGSKTICKQGGCAWIIAPCSTQVSSQWAGGQYNGIVAGDKCCISEWTTLQNALIAGGFNPTDWFVPNILQLCNPGVVCCSRWDATFTGSPGCYWSSTEVPSSAANAYHIYFPNPSTQQGNKSSPWCVRAMRCVNY